MVFNIEENPLVWNRENLASVVIDLKGRGQL